MFTVIDGNTDHRADPQQIIQTEAWANDLIWVDVQGFALTEHGELLLCDACGSFRFCPPGRFQIVALSHALIQPSQEQANAPRHGASLQRAHESSAHHG